MELEISILRPGDETVLERVAPEVFDDPIVLSRAGEFLSDPRHHLVVAIDAGIVVGFVSAVHYVHPDKPAPELWINEVGVAPTHQSHGIGKRLMRAMLDEASRIGCAEVWVLTSRSNTAANRLYQSVGGVTGTDRTVMYSFSLSPR